MTDPVSNGSAPPPVLPPNATESSSSSTVNNLIEDFADLVARNGIEGVSAAGTAVIVREFGEELKTLIQNDASIPQALKEDLIAFIDGQIGEAEAAAPHCCCEDMGGTPTEDALGQRGRLFAQGLAEATSQGLTGADAVEFANEHVAEAMNESTGTDSTSGGGGGAGGAGGASGGGGEGGLDDALDDAMMGNAEREAEQENEGGGAGSGSSRSGSRGGGGNWMIEMARALADVQSEFLDAAMKNLADMRSLSGDVIGEGESGEGTSEGSGSPGETAPGGNEGGEGAEQSNRQRFLTANAEYQANMQMFTTMSNSTATSLKAVGEGIASIARKQ